MNRPTTAIAQTELDEMSSFNDYQIEKIAEFFGWQVFEIPHRLSDGAWAGHIPFAFWLASTLQPKVFVELGVHTGNSYSAFCQAVETYRTPTTCFGIDSWEGDEHAGFYPEVLYKELKTYHDAKYSSFSRLMKMRFEEGLEYFQDQSIDLLHIDGLHTYEAVKNDFETWKPKLSERSIVLFHDTNVRERGFGVYKFWDEIKGQHPNFNFEHSNGLGVLGVGTNLDGKMKEFFDLVSEQKAAVAVKRYISRSGELLFNSWNADKTAAKLEAVARSAENIRDGRTHASNLLNKEKEAHKTTREKSIAKQTTLQKTVDIAEAKSKKDDLEIKELKASLAQNSRTIADLKETSALQVKKIALKEHFQRTTDRLEGRKLELEKEVSQLRVNQSALIKRIEALEASTSWKITSPLRKIVAFFEK